MQKTQAIQCEGGEGVGKGCKRDAVYHVYYKTMVGVHSSCYTYDRFVCNNCRSEYFKEGYGKKKRMILDQRRIVPFK